MRPLLLAGASVRALAWSARRAGFTPIGIDLFADSDLRAVAQAVRIQPTEYPDGFLKLASSFPGHVPLVYSGALENHPDLIDALSRQRPLWGVSGPALRAVRDPLLVAEVLRQAGLQAPPVRLDPSGLPRDGSWLQKPLASAGGRRITSWGPNSTKSAQPVYFQQRIRGADLSAVYVAGNGSARLKGVTVQVLGRGGSPFGYRGTCGPIPLSGAMLEQFLKIGEILAPQLGLLGLFGVDTVLTDRGPWVVEVNPRYSASVEVLELASGEPFLADHARVFDKSLECLRLAPRPRPGRVFGKMTVDAPVPFLFKAPPPVPDLGLWTVPEVADVPGPGTAFRDGDPVLTVFAEAADVSACLKTLHRRWQSWKARCHAR
jgi:predicted ATP-grasp superfamily ATP-dependent carboligase